MKIKYSSQSGKNMWRLTISGGELAALALSDEEQELLQESIAPDTPVSRVLFALTLLAGKIEGHGTQFITLDSRRVDVQSCRQVDDE